jgi:ParB-like chromosome segregation protein Spo0J
VTTASQLLVGEAVEVEVSCLKFGLSPRLGDRDQERVRLLAGVLDVCPPIIVERRTGSLIDGVHRVMAARMLGRKQIRAHMFDGSREEALVIAIRSNVTHGMPLTLQEREVAAGKVLILYPDWSDRRVGEVCGLSAKTVANLRQCPTADTPQLDTRTGRDGRRRPVDPSGHRAQIAQILQTRPASSNREVARIAGASPTTVAKVKRQITSAGLQDLAMESLSNSSTSSRRAVAEGLRPEPGFVDDTALLAMHKGPQFVAWLEAVSLADSDWRESISSVPLSRLYSLANHARMQSEAWTRFAVSLEQRARDATHLSAGGSSP